MKITRELVHGIFWYYKVKNGLVEILVDDENQCQCQACLGRYGSIATFHRSKIQ